MSQGVEVGAGLLPVPTTLPEERSGRDLDDELVDLLCEDAAWLEETFEEIVAASWASPPSGGGAEAAARPRRRGVQGGRGRRGGAVSRPQRSPRPQGRQRSPPVGA